MSHEACTYCNRSIEFGVDATFTELGGKLFHAGCYAPSLRDERDRLRAEVERLRAAHTTLQRFVDEITGTPDTDIEGAVRHIVRMRDEYAAENVALRNECAQLRAATSTAEKCVHCGRCQKCGGYNVPRGQQALCVCR